MIIEQLKDENNLTDSEKLIANYLLDESNNINNMTSTHLAKATFTSQSTVVRLYQKMGFKSYREFMAVLAVERKDFFRAEHLFNTENSNTLSSYEEAQNMLTKIYDNTITNTNHKIDRNTMIRICNRIFNASVVDIYAVGFCESIGAYLQSALETINIHCTLQNNINPYYLKSMENAKSHIAIIISIDNNDPLILKIAETLQNFHIYTVALSNNKYSKLSQLCQDIIQYDSTNISSYEETDTITSFLSIQYVIVFLISLLLAKKNNIISKY
ncbi:MAG: MurR/RpiR family transcriptional regulator [Erysipelotrichaceae bacterium]|nr:MurR/RpiR family transcriptional regulator [Erysipelotrichaceae bacterium]